ncbi:MAG: HNH endonuclease family protein [Actinomycetota bacterium]|nr:HNH endonuclease family protein [Actinomycetota bacterium]
MSGYSREKFPHWSKASEFGWDPPKSSCNAREAALIRDGEAVEVGRECKVESGTWFDPYTARTYTEPSDIDTDHVVPLANAWRSGASSWDNEQRERYANDPEVLLSVEDNANQSKGDKGPEAWKPPNEAVWCDYAVRWIGIKDKYDLSVNEQEKEALVEMLDACEGE